MTATPPTSPSASARMKPRDLLVYGLKELGLPEDDSTTNAFMLYLSELKKWNRAYSLTSIRKDEDVVLKHFLDSLLFLPALAPLAPLAQLGHSPRVADVGSGAGFPGIPIKIVRPDIHMTLIEPTQKKAAFLKHMVRTLNLKGVEVLEQRVEDLKGAGFDAALTRALYKIDEFIKKASPAVSPGGLLITSKGPSAKDELAHIGATRPSGKGATRPGGKGVSNPKEKGVYDPPGGKGAEYEIIKTTIPHCNIERNIITIKI